ncbi:predicted protein [Naegleria gruberi]|uniref:Predicted protein n=1 Tax=Naegleria gruberi TaxID=5762 RepID=D2UXB5_NAEGR|nr:uncharacterized protein NAEGRDRAFT_61704 [Naegleria gruberi]EFC50896.1 predicted protein [Naegleria gruberi]|eukprot:XP_002683640.1 predicted protein [Naegleria gruberi strain NEG-M]
MTNTAIKRIKKNNILNNNQNNHYLKHISPNRQQQQVNNNNNIEIISLNNNNQNNNLPIQSNNNNNIKSQQVVVTNSSPLRNVPTITDKEIENIQPIMMNQQSNTQSNNTTHNSHNTNSNNSHNTNNSHTEKFLKTSSVSDFKVQCKAEGSNVIFTFDKKVNIKRIRIKTPGNRRGPQYYSCFIPIIPNNTSIILLNNQSSNNFNNKSNRMKIGEGILEDSESIQYLNLFTKDEGVKCKELICTFCPFEGQKSFKIIDMKIECN